MMKRIFAIAIAVGLSVATIQAQTLRTLKVNLTEDGQANMVGYLPEQPTGKAVVGCPGGGYRGLSMQNEGHDWATYFNQQGIAYFVLTYRMPKGDRTIPIGDAEKAISTVRDSANVWHINPDDVGIMGFSAGGHLASTLATHSSGDAAANFQILFYPVISMELGTTHQGSRDNLLGKKPKRKEVNEYSNEQHVRKHTPRAFIALAGDDRSVPPANSLGYYEELCNNKVSATMHIYPAGGHGFGIRQSFPSHLEMMMELKAWLGSF